MTTAPISSTSIAIDRRMVAGAVCLLLGLFMLAGVGFAGPQLIHNAAHDTRHAVGFPCH
jgi:cobalt transporter subunit CbtB